MKFPPPYRCPACGRLWRQSSDPLWCHALDLGPHRYMRLPGVCCGTAFTFPAPEKKLAEPGL